MSRSRHHGCGRGCGVCSPHGLGPDHERQVLREAQLEQDVAVAQMASVACGCNLPSCSECWSQCARCGELHRPGRECACRDRDYCDTCGNWGPGPCY